MIDPVVVAAAERVLSRSAATPVRLSVEHVVPGTVSSIVMRVHADDTRTSLIVKAAHPRFPGADSMLFNDWAAAQLLTSLGAGEPICPRFHGGDPAVPLIVLEDLGSGAGSPYEVVEGDDPDAATASLIDYIRTIASLHVTAHGHGAEFSRIRQRLVSWTPVKSLYHDPWSDARPHTDAEIGTAIAEYREVLAGVGVSPRPGVDDEIAEVTRRVEAPGPYTTLCQGDQNGLLNCITSAGRPRLCDFGVAGYRHALIEGLPHRITWGCIRRVPPSVSATMDRVYREIVTAALSVSTADFEQAVTDALARWHILHVIHRLPEALRGDRPRGRATLRQQVIAWIDAFVFRHEEHGTRPELGRTAGSLAARLRHIWPEHTHSIPYFPAFAGKDPTFGGLAEKP